MNKKRLSKISKPNLPNTKLLITKKIIEKTGRNYIIKLNYNENKFNCSPNIKKNIEICSPNIYPEYHDVDLESKMEKISGIKRENFYFANGSDAILDAIPKTFGWLKNNNSNVLIPDLTYARLEITCNIVNLKIKKIKLKNWNIDLDEYLRNIDDNTSIIYIVNPNMPTGLYLNHISLMGFLEKIPTNIIVVIDEAYIEYAEGIKNSYLFDKELITKFSNVIITRTFSKLFGLASFRIGYCFSHKKNIEILKLTNQYLPVCKYSYQAAKSALDDLNYYDDIIQKTNEEKKYLYSEFKKMNLKYFKSKGNFIYIDLSNEKFNNKEVEDFLLKNYGVLIRCVKDNALRITVGTRSENKILISGLKEFFKCLK